MARSTLQRGSAVRGSDHPVSTGCASRKFLFPHLVPPAPSHVAPPTLLPPPLSTLRAEFPHPAPVAGNFFFDPLYAIDASTSLLPRPQRPEPARAIPARPRTAIYDRG